MICLMTKVSILYFSTIFIFFMSLHECKERVLNQPLLKGDRRSNYGHLVENIVCFTKSFPLLKYLKSFLYFDSQPQPATFKFHSSEEFQNCTWANRGSLERIPSKKGSKNSRGYLKSQENPRRDSLKSPSLCFYLCLE